MEHVVIDCSGRIGQETVEKMYEEALQAAKDGNMERAGNIARQAEKAQAEMKEGPTEYRRPLTPEEIEQRVLDAEEGLLMQHRMMRMERNARLAASDWTQIPNSPLTETQRAEWAVYRQELRDLPSRTSDPENPDWPKAPE